MTKINYIKTKPKILFCYLYLWQCNNFLSIGYSDQIKDYVYYIKNVDKEFLEKLFIEVDDDFLYKIAIFKDMKTLL
jgi:hypothetical protein